MTDNIKAVLFDMDGLIFDTERLAETGWVEAGEKLNFFMTKEMAGQIRGCDVPSSRKLFDRWFGQTVSYDEAKKLRTDYILNNIRVHGMPVKEGMHELIAYLKQHGYKTALATSTQREIVDEYFRNTDLPFTFDTTVCGTEVAHGKPAPDIFLEAASRLKIQPGQCLVLEDSPNGVTAGHAAGCKVIMIPDMDMPDTALAEKCTAIVNNHLGVIEFLKEENNK